MSLDPKTPVSVEDLLRFKRCEAPSAEFWNDFDRELRSKQLAAIVEKRPWWAGFSRMLQRFARYRIPMGAAAALAAAVAGFHEYRVVALRSSAEGLAGGDIPAANVAGTDAGLAPNGMAVDADGIERQIVPEAQRRTRASTVAYHETEPAGPSSLRPWVISRSQLQGDMSPSERSIEASLAAVRASQPEILSHILSLSQRFDSQLVPENRHVAEPLAQISSISQDRRERLLAEVVATLTGPAAVPAPTSDRLMRTLSDDRINEEAISRYQMGSSSDLPSLSIRF